MAANATINILGADKTAQAFASVQNRLTKMHATAKQVSTGLATFFGFSALVGGVKRLDAFLEDAEKNAKKLGLTSEDLDKLTIATDAADQAAMKLQATAALGAANLAGMFTGGDVAAKAAEIRFTRLNDVLEVHAEKLRASRDEIRLLADSAPSQRFAQMGKEMERLNKQIKDSDPSVDAVKNAERAQKGMDLQKSRAELAIASFRSMDQALHAVTKTEADFANATMSDVDQQKALNHELAIRKNVIQAYKEELGADKMGEFDYGLATEEDIQMLELLGESLKEYNELLGKRKIIETDLQRISGYAGEMIAHGFEDAILSGQKLSEVVRGLAQDLLRMVFNQTITAPLAGMISGGIASAFGGMRAAGGPVGTGSSYLVGENGPELFVPSTAGRIMNEHQMGGGGGGGGGTVVNLNYNIASGVTRAELKPILDQQRAQLRREIPDAVRRGGSYRTAFA